MSTVLYCNIKLPHIIRHLQLENQALKNENHTLGEKNKTLSSNQCRRSSAQVPDELKVFNVELSTFSHKYRIVVEMFPPEHHILKLPVPNPPPAIISKSHYASKSAEELSLMSELYSLLPDHLHWFVPTSHFQLLLEQQLQGSHSSAIGKLRVMAGQIFSLNPSYFDIGFTNQDTIPEIQKMLGMTGPGSCSTLLKFPPVLFMRQERDPMMSMVFRNREPLTKAIRIVVWQSTSSSNIATSDAEGEHLTSNLMHLALANAGHKDRESDSLTTDDHHVSLVLPSSPTLALAAPPAFPLTALAPAITPAVETTATITPAAPVVLAADETPPVPDVPDSVEMLQPAASSSGRRGHGRGKRGRLVAISLSAEQ
ncbi:uncharacterized protein F5891DRAFT_1197278 [Suillus fuscotomentosus]|uniref:Uncharacterized protein n=1 Tax=Suillus fuscotomentosus TaxID=1912939 RepID=A0AAD4HE13_9AGAM|nr:uncharacterized protein F5891DRAFT_1197278 [Suillus fuscotomentosus]KAG1891836.1 hypothetical protein F5891DRAFT_1197278 [Suillus fuscotomentosus]